jgi:hypothetical protein
MDEKRFRFDLFIALCALLVSSVAAGASAYQTYVINQQYQASIWPYLGFSLASSPKRVALTVHNYGLGPSLIRTFDVRLNGKPVPTFNEAIAPYMNPHKGDADTNVSTLGDGSIISAGETAALVSVDNPDIVKRIMAHPTSIDLTICYCSLLGRCWIKSLQDPSAQPHDIGVCPLPALPKTRLYQS